MNVLIVEFYMVSNGFDKTATGNRAIVTGIDKIFYVEVWIIKHNGS